MITYEDALQQGMNVVQICAKKFWTSNREAYLKFGFDEADMIGYLNLHILVRRYLKHADEHPEFYEGIENYKASLYTACWKACLAHYRQLCAKKRQDAFRPGAMVYLDQPIEHGDGEDHVPVVENSLMLTPTESMDDYIKRTADHLLTTCGCLTSRVFVLLSVKGVSFKQLTHSIPRAIRHERLSEITRTIRTHLLAA